MMARSPSMTKRTPRKTRYLGLSKAGHKETKKAAPQKIEIKVM